MKKVLMVLLLIGSLQAKPNADWFLGAGYFDGEVEQTTTAVTSTVATRDISYLDLNVGAIFANSNRIQFSWIEMDITNQIDIKSRELDWIYTANLNNKKNPLLPFFSAGVGTQKQGALDGYSVQAKIGIYLQLDLEIEISYKEQIIEWEESAGSDRSDRMNGYYFGLKYKI